MSAAAKVKLLPFELEIVSGPHLGQKFAFVDKISITIGRGAENAICLQHDPRASRVHAEIKQENENFYVYNKTKQNSLLINGRQEDQFKIMQSCTITIGETDLKFILPQPTPKMMPNPLKPLVPQGMTTGAAPVVLPQMPPGPVLKQHVPSPYSGQLPPQNGAGGMPSSPPRRRKPAPKKESFNPVLLLVVAGVILALVFVFPSKKDDSEKPVKEAEIVEATFRDEQRLKEAMDRSRDALTKMENQNSRQAMAQQFFISGMREFLNGNYHRAVSFLNSAYQSDPTLVDADKFSREAQRKLDRLIDFHFSEGLKYRDNNNFRMCKSSFQTVQLYIRNNLKHPRYVEAKQYYDECTNLDRVRRF